jgi:signal transduction histidine kinase
LALSIHRMAQRIAAYEAEIRQSERLQTLDRMGAALGHQLRNAATGASMAIEFHRRDCPLAPGDESLEVALRQLRLMESYLERFLSVDRQRRGPLSSVCLGTIVDDVLALAGPNAKHCGVEVSVVSSGQPLSLRGDADALRQLATNLLTNAIDAAQGRPDGSGRVEIALTSADGRRGRLEVRDNGPGPAAAIADRLFEAFVSAKRDGVGLGLWLARRIAEAHGGSLQWRRDEGATAFAFEFPLSEETAHGAHADRR